MNPIFFSPSSISRYSLKVIHQTARRLSGVGQQWWRRRWQQVHQTTTATVNSPGGGLIDSKSVGTIVRNQARSEIFHLSFYKQKNKNTLTKKNYLYGKDINKKTTILYILLLTVSPKREQAATVFVCNIVLVQESNLARANKLVCNKQRERSSQSRRERAPNHTRSPHVHLLRVEQNKTKIYSFSRSGL